jgi:hypothetical protein
VLGEAVGPQCWSQSLAAVNKYSKRHQADTPLHTWGKAAGGTHALPTER